MVCYQYAPAEAVDHGDGDVGRVGAESDELIHVLVVHVSHLYAQRTHLYHALYYYVLSILITVILNVCTSLQQLLFYSSNF